MRYATLLLGGVLALAGPATRAAAQAPAPREDETPFVRPEPLSTVITADPAGLLSQIRQRAEREGFTVSRINAVAGELEAVKPDGPDREDFDKVLVWIERDLNRGDALKIYVLYGRYEKVFGKVPPIRRIKTDEAREAVRIGPLKKLLVALSEGGQ